MPVAVRPKTEKRQHPTATRTGSVPRRRRLSTGHFTVVESISRPTPQWLPWVIWLQKMTKPLALLSLASVLVVYGMNVVKQREWSTQFDSLSELQAQKNSLVTLTERKKYQIPQSLEVAPKGYVELKQDRVLFVPPEPSREFKSAAEPEKRQSVLQEDRLPIGY